MSESPSIPASAPAPYFSPGDLFNCWPGGVSPSPEEVALWDALEVHGVRDVSDDGDGTWMEACDDDQAEFWSVYGHYRPTNDHVGLECITDGPAGNQAAAIAIAEYLGKLWGLPVRA